MTPTGTKEISIAENGTTTHDVTDYANAEVTVNVPTPTDYLAALLENELTSYTVTTSNIKQHTFRGATNLTSVAFPASLTTIEDYAFTGTRLVYAVLHAVETMGSNAFSAIPSLTAVDIGSLGEIYTSIFNGDASLNVLVLRGNTMTTLRNINALKDTPFASGGTGGKLYVPQSLISDYQGATNWSTILGYPNNSIQSIESSIYKTQYVDGTPIATT